MSDELEHPQGLDGKIFTGKREADGGPIMRFPTLGDVDGIERIFDREHADECIRSQHAANMPNKENAIATMKGIFALAKAEQNDMIKNGWGVDFTERTTISPAVIDAVIEKFKKRN